VLQSVELFFPLLVAAEQERTIASGQRLAAEGAFDLNLRSRGITQGGTFPSNRFDLAVEQPTIFGPGFFAGYRLGRGDFPVYYGDRLTADGGEFRAGVVVPLLRDLPIDRRRAALRQAQIGEALADPVVQRARIDYFRAAARAYWSWVAAGEQYAVAESLFRIARDRQGAFEEQFKRGQVAEFVVIDNRRLVVEREGARIAAERRFQQTSFDLSLFLRDPAGNPEVPPAARLPRGFTDQEPTVPCPERLREDIQTAYRLRPELVRFALLKERAAVDLRLAENQQLPALNAAVAGNQDVGKGKESPGIFALERSVIEGSLLLDVPLQRREARGRARAAQGALLQLLAQERYARDQIGTEVQDALSNLDRTYQRLQRAREEQGIALRVADLERERFRKGQSNLLEVNLRELAAANAQAKVIDTLADYFRAQAEYRAALGLDAQSHGPLAPK
jgi:outer membrane protein TolC